MYLSKKIFTLLIITLAFPLTFYAQGKNFIYIQSERKQPYYVILNNKTNSSTPEGYIILPQIPHGKHLITIGFPKNLFPEQQFLLEITEDKGYSFKKTPNNGWQLFDLNNFVTINPVTNIDSAIAETKKPYVPELPKKDTIAVVKEVPKPVEVAKPVVEEVKKTEPIVVSKPVEVVEQKLDTVAVAKPVIVAEKKLETVEPSKPVAVIEKKVEPVAEIKRAELNIPVYVDTVAKKSDSIVVIHKKDTIETITTTITEKKIDSVVVKKENKPSSIRLILEKQQATGIDKIFTDSTELGIDTIAVYIPMPAIPKTVKTSTGINTTAIVEKILMTDDEFKSLRLLMASAATDEDMTAVAVKNTTKKLLEVKQVKNLSTLYLNEDSKLTFFKSIKGSIKDQNNFPSLVGELSEAKNIAAFKEL